MSKTFYLCLTIFFIINFTKEQALCGKNPDSEGDYPEVVKNGRTYKCSRTSSSGYLYGSNYVLVNGEITDR